MLRNNFFRHWYNWHAIVVGLTALAVIFNQFIDWRNWSPQDWASWVSAIGTCLAFAGTIYLARGETRRRERIEQSQMLLRTPEMAGKLDSKIAGVNVSANLLALAYDTRASIPATRSCSAILRQVPGWDENELAPFLSLQGHVAYRLVRSQGGIRLAATVLDAMDTSHMDVEEFFTYYGTTLKSVIDWLLDAEEDLQAVRDALDELVPDV